MDWRDTVELRLKKKNSILFSQEDAYLEDLKSLISAQSHRTLVLWALSLAEETVAELEARNPQERRPRAALETTKLWAAGEVKMPAAKREILNCHALAKELSNPEEISLCHAVGQACGVVHTRGHAMGYPVYDLTAIVRRLGIGACGEAVEERKRIYLETLLDWSGRSREYAGPWAEFLGESSR